MTTKTQKSTKSKKVFNFKTIKVFEDACKRTNLNPEDLPDVSRIPERFKKRVIGNYKAAVINEAIVDGWIADFTNWNQKKWTPFVNLSSGCVFSDSSSYYTATYTVAGSRLWFETEAQSDFFAKQFPELLKDITVIPK
jgi:hypothetical protein